MGFYYPDSGQILIDGVDLQKISIKGFRKKVGYLDSKSALFDTSIRNNIAGEKVL